MLAAAIVDRLIAANRHRWELSDPVVSALEHVELDPTGAEVVLTGFVAVLPSRWAARRAYMSLDGAGAR